MRTGSRPGAIRARRSLAGRRTPRRRVRVVEDRGSRGDVDRGRGGGGRAHGGRLPPAPLDDQSARTVRTAQAPALVPVAGDRGGIRLDRSAGRRRRRPVDRRSGPGPRGRLYGDRRRDVGPVPGDQDARPPLDSRRRPAGPDAPGRGRQDARQHRAASEAPAGPSLHAPLRQLVVRSHSARPAVRSNAHAVGEVARPSARCSRFGGCGEVLPPCAADAARGAGRLPGHCPRLARGRAGPHASVRAGRRAGIRAPEPPASCGRSARRSRRPGRRACCRRRPGTPGPGR